MARGKATSDAAPAKARAKLGPATFRFFRDLSRNNSKAWMDENRDRYQSALVQPLRTLLDELTLAAQKLYPRFHISGRTGVNFSRINRDIRFAKDKTPYRPQMYLSLPARGRPGELYIGFTGDTVTAGFASTTIATPKPRSSRASPKPRN